MWQDEHLENASDLSVDSITNKERVNDLLNDPRAFKIKRVDRNGFTRKITLFSTGPFGTNIRNAVTGFNYVGDMVGSPSEELYFKVRFSTGESRIEAPTLFYDNPEQWERHANVNCPTIIKNNWYVKFRNEMKKRKNPQFISILQEVEKLEQNKFYNFTSTLFSQNLFSPTLSSGENVNFNKETNIKTIEIK